MRGRTPGVGIVLLAVALAAGCAPLPAVPPLPEPLTQRARVVWEGDPAPPARRRRLFRYLDLAERVYLARFGGDPLPVAGITLERCRLLPGARLGEHRVGWIRLPWRGLLALVAIVHELHHARHGDGEHERADWPAVNRLGVRLALQEWVWGTR